MDDGPAAWALLAAVVAALFYRQLLVLTRDVPPEYLTQQSVVAPTRTAGELAVHKSTKLDYSQGLRVGLGIRYDSYRLRNGNLYDVWELAVRHARHDPACTVFFGHTPVLLAQLNACVAHVRLELSAAAQHQHYHEVRVHCSLVLASPEAFAVLWACFTSQRTVHVHDGSAAAAGPHVSAAAALDVCAVDGDVVVRRGAALVLNVSRSVLACEPTTHFDNKYSFDKDRGVALKVSCRANHMAAVCTSFVQTNLVSAAASCLKHLPPLQHIGPRDRLAVVYDTSSIDGLVNGIVKVLVALVAGAQLHLAPRLACIATSPTIILARDDVVAAMPAAPTGFDRALRLHRLYSLSCNRFSGLCRNKPFRDLRLVFAHRSLSDAHASPDWRHVCAALAARVVVENGYYNAAGPLLVSDFYDYRSFSRQVSAQTRSHGAVAQSNEIKLTDFDGVSSGMIAARGYNFGKAKTVLESVGETLVTPDEDGFYRIPVLARWGLDGCMYVMRQ